MLRRTVSFESKRNPVFIKAQTTLIHHTDMSQSQRKGSSRGARGNTTTGKGGRPKQKNNANVNLHSQARGRGALWNCSICDNAVDEDEQAIECHVMQTVEP